jgi:tyrosyl-tRNA synthetase
MEVIRDDHDADDTIRYCPAWSAANKPGRPAKGKRKLSALETAQGIKRKPKYLTRFCQICRGFSHRMIDCWLQEKNKQHRPQAWKGQLAQEMIEEAAEEAAVEEAMRILECEGNGDKEGTVDDEEGTADDE